MNQILMVRLLKQLGHTSDIVSNGLEVLEALKTKKYDFILMDVQMPELDGIETIRRIRSNPDIRPSPQIIALTANHLEKTRVSCLDAGANEFLTKPVSISNLQAAIEQRPTPQLHQSENDLFKRLNELQELGDAKFVHELIDLFMHDSLIRIREIEEAVAQLEWPQAQKISHLMKGSAANMGAKELQDVCHVLQEACSDKNSTMASVALRQAEDALNRTGAKLNEWRNSKTT